MSECMTFPDTVEEFMDSYMIVDTEHVYTNGTEMVPIYRMKQWFEHESEMNFDEWCTDCKEYDHEKHCCPRFNRVIKQTLEEVQPEIIRCKDCKHRPIEKYGEIMPPKEDDWKCPCLCDDYFYSWRPKDNYFCASGERRTDEEDLGESRNVT